MKQKIQALSGGWFPLVALLIGLFLHGWPLTVRADSLDYWNLQPSVTTN